MKRKQSIIKIVLAIIVLLVCSLFIRSLLVENKEKIIKFSRLKKNEVFLKGEWISNLDSSSGISVRKNKLAFFKNMTFESKDIYKYEILDSFHKTLKKEIFIGEFLKIMDYSDTVYHQIIKRNDSIIMLKMGVNRIETFKLKTK